MKPQKYGYIDESGSPGIAHGPNDYLLVCMVLFQDYDAARNANARIADLRTRLNLSKHYEFHRAKNSPRVQRSFENLMSQLDFQIVAVAAHKDRFRQTSSYTKLAEMLLSELATMQYDDIRIRMDTNPVLFKAFRKYVKRQGMRGIKIQEEDSSRENLLQLADYSVNMLHAATKKTGRRGALQKFLKDRIISYQTIDKTNPLTYNTK